MLTVPSTDYPFAVISFVGLSTTIPSTTVSSTTVPSTSLYWLVNSTVNENKNGLQSSIKMLLKIADLKVPDLSFYTCLCLVFSFVLFILAFYLKCLWLFLHSLKPFITLEILGQMPQDLKCAWRHKLFHFYLSFWIWEVRKGKKHKNLNIWRTTNAF